VLTKSTPLGEVVARVRATLRRTGSRHQEEERAVIRTGAIEIDRTSRIVTKNGMPVQLSRTEYRLLDALALRIGQVAPHRLLLSNVWGGAFVDGSHYLRMYMGYLRQKLEDDPRHPRYLRNEWGLGYRLALLPARTEAEEEGAEAPEAAEAREARPTTDSQG